MQETAGVRFPVGSQTIVGDGAGMSVVRTVGSNVTGRYAPSSVPDGKERHPQVVQKRIRQMATPIMRERRDGGNGNTGNTMLWYTEFWRWRIYWCW